MLAYCLQKRNNSSYKMQLFYTVFPSNSCARLCIIFLSGDIVSQQLINNFPPAQNSIDRSHGQVSEQRMSHAIFFPRKINGCINITSKNALIEVCFISKFHRTDILYISRDEDDIRFQLSSARISNFRLKKIINCQMDLNNLHNKNICREFFCISKEISDL